MPSVDPREVPSEGETYSKDSLDIVCEQLGRRPLFRIGVVILALLYAVAIYAPLLANDRPYMLEAVDVKEYTSAVRSLSPVTSSVVRLLGQSREEYLETRGESALETWDAALAVEEEAAHARLAILGAALSEVDRGPLEVYRDRLGRALSAGRAGAQDQALALGQEAKEMAKAFRDDLAARAPDGGLSGSDSPAGVSLRGARRFPLFESLSHWEILFMALWLWLLCWPIWNRAVNRLLLAGERERIRHWRRRKLGVVLGSSGLAAIVWAATVGGQWTPFATAPFKSGLDDGGIALEYGDWSASRAPVFPPIAMGYAETHPEERFRPPTWTRASQVDSRGCYLHGFRAPDADSITGVEASLTPVEVRYAEPGANSYRRHLAGTDELGRDLLVRMMWGSRVSLSVGILSALLLTVIGVVIGSMAGYMGGWVDVVIMRLIEILQSIPAFFLIIVTMAFTDPDVVPPIFSIVFVIAIIRWTGVARLVRGEFLKLRDAEFVVAAKALGYSSRRTIFVHILPNAMSPVLVSAAFAVAAGILTESAVSYLGFGIQHPGASWGSLVNESKSSEHWWIQIFPGMLIFLTVTCYNLVGDAVRDALDPKMKVEA